MDTMFAQNPSRELESLSCNSFAHPHTKGLACCHLPIVLWRATDHDTPEGRTPPTSQLTNFSMMARNPFGSLNSTAVRRHLDAYNRLKTPFSFTTWDKITRRLNSWKRLKVGRNSSRHQQSTIYCQSSVEFDAH